MSYIYCGSVGLEFEGRGNSTVCIRGLLIAFMMANILSALLNFCNSCTPVTPVLLYYFNVSLS
jgi:hypothetical protein